MTQGWKSVAFACALGGLIGTLCAQEIAAHFQYGARFASFGTLIGGAVAYLIVDFWQLYAGVKLAWAQTINWKPHKLWWRAFGAVFAASFAITPTIVIAFGILPVIGALLFPSTEMAAVDTLVSVISGGAAFSVLAAIVTGITLGHLETARKGAAMEAWETRLYEVIERNWDLAKIANPIAVGCFVARHLLRGLWFAIPRMPQAIAMLASWLVAAAKLLGAFLRAIFVAVHSERRLICLVDATLGALVGYHVFGIATAGAIAGMILGVINFEVVSVRWLKIVPATR